MIGISLINEKHKKLRFSFSCVMSNISLLYIYSEPREILVKNPSMAGLKYTVSIFRVHRKAGYWECNGQ